MIHTFILNERTNQYFNLVQGVCSNYDFIIEPSMIYFSFIDGYEKGGIENDHLDFLSLM